MDERTLKRAERADRIDRSVLGAVIFFLLLCLCATVYQLNAAFVENRSLRSRLYKYEPPPAAPETTE